MVAEAVAILWKPRVGRMTRLSAPWSASMMLFKYFDVRCSTFFDSRPSFRRRWIALGYEAVKAGGPHCQGVSGTVSDPRANVSMSMVARQRHARQMVKTETPQLRGSGSEILNQGV
jgi:hypothetical protein